MLAMEDKAMVALAIATSRDPRIGHVAAQLLDTAAADYQGFM